MATEEQKAIDTLLAKVGIKVTREEGKGVTVCLEAEKMEATGKDLEEAMSKLSEKCPNFLAEGTQEVEFLLGVLKALSKKSTVFVVSAFSRFRKEVMGLDQRGNSNS